MEKTKISLAFFLLLLILAFFQRPTLGGTVPRVEEESETSDSWATWAKEKLSEGFGIKHQQDEKARGVEDAVHKAEEVKDAAAEKASETAETGADKAWKAKEAAQEKADDLDATKENAGKEMVGETTADKARKAKEAAEEVVSKAKEGFEAAKSKTEEALDATKEKLSSNYQRAKEKVVDDGREEL